MESAPHDVRRAAPRARLLLCALAAAACAAEQTTPARDSSAGQGGSSAEAGSDASATGSTAAASDGGASDPEAAAAAEGGASASDGATAPGSAAGSDAAVRAGNDGGGRGGQDGSVTMSDAGTGAPGRQPSGYASTASDGLSTTRGGGSARPDIARDCAQLKSWLEDATARVIELADGTTLDCRTNSRAVQACELSCKSGSSKTFLRVPVGEQTCSSLADFNGDGTLDVPAGTLVNKQRNDSTIHVKSNKTLRGAGSGATLLGVSLVIDKQSNIILQNLALREINPSLIEAGDGVTVENAHHVWIDHCAFSMISDGYVDIRGGSRAITLSYNHIDGKNDYVCDGQHNFISLVSDSDVTFDHNFFDHVGGRNPKVTGASQVHLYSNYYDGVSYFCASAGAGSKLLVEANSYANSRYPHWAEGGSIEASGNRYSGSTSSAGRDVNADLPAPPYPYALEPVDGLSSALPTKVGPGSL